MTENLPERVEKLIIIDFQRRFRSKFHNFAESALNFPKFAKTKWKSV